VGFDVEPDDGLLAGLTMSVAVATYIGVVVKATPKLIALPSTTVTMMSQSRRLRMNQ
jgi:hypothetical protein